MGGPHIYEKRIYHNPLNQWRKGMCDNNWAPGHHETTHEEWKSVGAWYTANVISYVIRYSQHHLMQVFGYRVARVLTHIKVFLVIKAFAVF